MTNQFLVSLINGIMSGSAQKQNVVTLSALAALPDKNDFAGKFQINDNICDGDFLGLHGERKIGAEADISIEIFISKDQKKINDAFSRYFGSEPIYSDRSFSGKKFGEKMYIDILEGETHSFRRIVVRDGQAVIAITMTAKPMIVEGKALRLPDNTVRTYRLYADDTSLIEKLMVRMLDRLTVLGLTSKPISSASEAARKYVAAKQKNPPKVRIFEKGVEQGITR